MHACVSVCLCSHGAYYPVSALQCDCMRAAIPAALAHTQSLALAPAHPHTSSEAALSPRAAAFISSSCSIRARSRSCDSSDSFSCSIVRGFRDSPMHARICWGMHPRAKACRDATMRMLASRKPLQVTGTQAGKRQDKRMLL